MSSDPKKPAHRPPTEQPTTEPAPDATADETPQPKFVCALCGYPRYGVHC